MNNGLRRGSVHLAVAARAPQNTAPGAAVACEGGLGPRAAPQVVPLAPGKIATGRLDDLVQGQEFGDGRLWVGHGIAVLLAG